MKKTKIKNILKTMKKVTLKEKLGQIYNLVDLNTTCCRNITCCRVGCPSMNFSEFTQLIQEIWDGENKERKVKIICTSLEYFFRYEFNKFGTEIFHKPCMLLDEENKRCGHYDSRPLSCRLYGLWPEQVYNARVDKFEKAYAGLATREQLPLNKQCPYVKRTNTDAKLSEAVINDLYAQLDALDGQIGGYSAAMIRNKENYRTLHDWLLLKVFGEDFLSSMTTFLLAADKNIILDQLEQLKKTVREKFAKDMPKI